MEQARRNIDWARSAETTSHMHIPSIRNATGMDVAIHEVVIQRRPFGNLIRLEKDGPAGPTVLLASPLSGHRPMLMRDLALGLLPSADVHFIAWADASQVPLACGPFGLDDNIDYIIGFIRCLGPQTHVIGLSQSPLPTLAAAALLAEGWGHGAEPRSMTLMSGFLDPRINPTPLGLTLTALAGWSFALLCDQIVPAKRAGGGRHVYPASRQVHRLLMYLRRHLLAGKELASKVMFDDSAAGGPPFLELFLTLADLPFEVVMDGVRTVFHEYGLPTGRLRWHGQLVHPGAIRRSGLLTVEAGDDDISAVGQTRIAHDLCRGIGGALRAHHVEPGIGHFGTFHGSVWRARILPRLLSFLRVCEETGRRTQKSCTPYSQL